MPNAFLFPGQGSQYVGMGKDYYDQLDSVKERYHTASEILEFNLEDISFSGPEDTLRQTQFTQPAIFVHSIIVNDLLKEKEINTDAVAGHSLGEFSALVSAEVLTFEDALQIVKVRSTEMANAGKKAPGAMAAIIGADKKQLEIICHQEGIVVLANMNAPGQAVISGDKNAVEAAINTAKKIGIRGALPLRVSGAFHSPLMRSAREPLLKVINSVNFMAAKTPVYQNVQAKPVTDKSILRENILKQLESPVLWSDTISNMKKEGISNFFEVGPGKVLKGLNKRIFPESTTMTCDKLAHLDVCEV